MLLLILDCVVKDNPFSFDFIVSLFHLFCSQRRWPWNVGSLITQLPKNFVLSGIFVLYFFLGRIGFAIFFWSGSVRLCGLLILLILFTTGPQLGLREGANQLNIPIYI